MPLHPDSAKPNEEFHIAVGPLDRRLNETANAPTLIPRPAEYIFQHSAMDGRIPDNTILAHRLRPVLELLINKPYYLHFSLKLLSDTPHDQLEQAEREYELDV